jgi:hypothetical protein
LYARVLSGHPTISTKYSIIYDKNNWPFYGFSTATYGYTICRLLNVDYVTAKCSRFGTTASASSYNALVYDKTTDHTNIGGRVLLSSVWYFSLTIYRNALYGVNVGNLYVTSYLAVEI